MKKHLLSLLVFCLMGVGSTFAQSEIVVGDMNDDGQLTVGDVTALSETVIGRKPARRVAVSGDPYAVNNSSIVGRWSGVSGTVTFNADGTTDYKDGYRYEYLPAQCLVVFYDTTGAANECLEIIKLDKNALVLADASFTKFYTYGEHVFIAEDGSIYYEDASGHRYVDLGLPSGTLWATCNVGAESPEDYGYYFAWGEIEPKDTYNWSTYFDSVNGSSSNFKKYYNGGGKTELDLEDDAAYMNWGEGWRMPSRAQQDELRDTNNCSWTWTKINDKNGYLVKSKRNDSSLFLPAAGYRIEGSLSSAGAWGYYWSRSLYTSYSNYAYGLLFESSGNDWDGYGRYGGFSVRPVRVSSQN